MHEHDRLAPGAPLRVYKNNVDGKGASYGTHENYLVDRAVPFGDLAHYLTPFFVSRQVVTGAGRVELLPFLHEQAISITAHRFGTPDHLTEGVL